MRDRRDLGLPGRALRALRLVAVYAVGVISILGSGSTPSTGGGSTPSPMSVFPQRYTFGGDVLPVSIRLAAPVPAGPAATFSVSTDLPAGTVTLPTGLSIAPGASELTFNVQTQRVSTFVNGRIDVTWTNYGTVPITGGQPVMLMPEPTALQLSFAPAAVPGGQPVTLGLAITPAYPIDLLATLSADSPLLAVPAQIMVPAGGAASLPVSTGTTTTARAVIVTARLRGAVDIESMLVNTTASGQVPLTVAVSGGGRLTSAPAGIDCGSVCAAAFTIGARVTLTPVPDAGQRFYAWSGDADCSDGVLTMAAARACTAVFAPALAPYPDGAGWRLLGAALTLASEVDPAPSLARDGNHPLVAYVEALGGDVARLFVKRFDGTAFVTLGSGALNAGSVTAASEPSLVTTANGQPYVAWVQGNGVQQNVFVARFNGSTWESVGPAGVPLNSAAGSLASQPSIALDAERQPMVAWLEAGSVRFKRFNGSDWVASPAGSGLPSSGVDRVRMGADLDGMPVIAWREGSGAAQALKVVRGFDFTPLGTQVVAGGGPAVQFALHPQVSGADLVYAATETPINLRAVSWSGTAWVDQGQLVTNDPRRLGAVAFARNLPSVALVVGDSVQGNATLTFSRRDSTSQTWQGVVAPLGSTFAARPLTLSHDWVTTASPLLATSQQEVPGQYTVRVRRFYP